ncbi:UDP-glycosyltransferase 91C1-like [Pyrus ussuriensis x Pyrus communis]|uniref:UDP-glycosyltransferase 91C1-like n=1 Tax=Pyrus ussuriensis x Pyrus communis TaxID=2448454 RepID=A0A5N5F0P0_9ROSA|nr:UDP-glycosyltransferase 91C1-like [Pyrus ussuriensis x Pyrus communis]
MVGSSKSEKTKVNKLDDSFDSPDYVALLARLILSNFLSSPLTAYLNPPPPQNSLRLAQAYSHTFRPTLGHQLGCPRLVLNRRFPYMLMKTTSLRSSLTLCVGQKKKN